MGSQDDHIGMLGRRGRHDHFDRISLPDKERGVGTGRSRSGDDGLGGGFDPAPLLIDPLDEPAARQAQATWVDDAQDDELGTMLRRQLDRLIGGPVRDG